MRHILHIIVLLILMLCACNHASSSSDNRDEKQIQLRKHILSYWDTIDICSQQKSSLEQHFVDFLYLTQHLDSIYRQECWKVLNEKFPGEAPINTVVYYLSDQKSPIYSPNLLEDYLSGTLALLAKDDNRRHRVKYLLDNIKKNKIGSKIEDLDLLKNKNKCSLHSLIKQSGKKVVIIFYDPDCHECDQLLSYLSVHNIPQHQIIAISIGKSEKTLPSAWITARVSDPIQLDDRYYLNTIPAVFVVDTDYTVLSHEIQEQP
ncbi:MAG: thioredoxin family protein [Prevotella sp.]|nr:thioredoxin family protein [Bacteroides sp.]MCM1366159.1 thioredoxin family protein [Prevotella sp.]MCM1436776.1 thioredoxin family protein [Prevotella sp.]